MNVSGAGPRTSSTKTRIETIEPGPELTEIALVRGRVPRKQGLKRLVDCVEVARQGSPRTSSTKTRIETDRAGKISRNKGQSEDEFHENKD